MRFSKMLFAFLLVVASFSIALAEPQEKSDEGEGSSEVEISVETKASEEAKTSGEAEQNNEAKSEEQSDEAERLGDATTVVNEFSSMAEGTPRLIEDAAGVVVIPGLIKAGLVIGGKHGKGVLTIKNKDGSWTEPVFVKMTGGSVGFQVGASSTDLVLLFMREKNIRDVLDGEFTLGGNASVAAGPVGRTGSADTSAKLDAEIYSYSRSRGVFAGISLDGSKLYVDKSANAAFYGEKATPKSIVAASPSAESPTASFRAALTQLAKPSE